MGNQTPTPEQIAAFEKEQKLGAQEDELVKRIKRRFTVALISVSVVGFFGIQAVAWIVIDQMHRPRMDAEVAKAITAVTNANNAAESAKRATSDATQAGKQAKEAADTVSAQAATLSEDLASLKKEIKVARDDFGAQIEGARKAATVLTEKSVNDLDKQLAIVERQVVALTKLAERRTAAADRTLTKLRQAGRLESEQAKLRNTAGSTRKTLADNSKFKVSLLPSERNLSLARKLVNGFEEAGFQLYSSNPTARLLSFFKNNAKIEKMTIEAFTARPTVLYQARSGEAESKLDAIQKIAEPLLGGQRLRYLPSKNKTMSKNFFAIYLP